MGWIGSSRSNRCIWRSASAPIALIVAGGISYTLGTLSSLAGKASDTITLSGICSSSAAASYTIIAIAGYIIPFVAA